MPEVQCPNCRSVNSSDASFCSSCGGSLAAAKAAAAAPLVPMPTMGGGSAAASSSPPAPAAPTPTMGAPPPQATSPAVASPPAPMGAVPAAVPGVFPPASTAFPPPPLHGVGQPGQPIPPEMMNRLMAGKAAFVDRLIAFFIDAVMCAVVSWVLSPLWWAFYPLSWIFWWWSGAAILAVYMLIMETSQAQTVGKMLMNLKVVRLDGAPITQNDIKSRAIGVLLYPLLIPALLDLMYASDQGQTIGDRWAKTTVMKVQ